MCVTFSFTVFYLSFLYISERRMRMNEHDPIRCFCCHCRWCSWLDPPHTQRHTRNNNKVLKWALLRKAMYSTMTHSTISCYLLLCMTQTSVRYESPHLALGLFFSSVSVLISVWMNYSEYIDRNNFTKPYGIIRPPYDRNRNVCAQSGSYSSDSNGKSSQKHQIKIDTTITRTEKKKSIHRWIRMKHLYL